MSTFVVGLPKVSTGEPAMIACSLSHPILGSTALGVGVECDELDCVPELVAHDSELILPGRACLQPPQEPSPARAVARAPAAIPLELPS